MAKKSEQLVVAICDGMLSIGGVDIPCAVLEDGRRVLTQQGVLLSLGRARAAKGGEGVQVDGNPAFLRANNIKPFINKELIVSTTPIPFRTKSGANAWGYPAETLPMICDVFLDAEEAGVLLASQKHIAARCKMLIRGFARVGITALVDEATGYQYERERNALEEILNRFIATELRKWTKTFPSEYYQQLFRLRRWRLPPDSSKRSPQVGKDTNNLIYERLAPGVLEELRIKNPKLPSGQRKYKHHQWLSDDFGDPRLRQHIHAVVGLMKASNSWGEFKTLIDRAFPRYPDKFRHPQLPFPE